jgi:hypothetical protein
MVGLVGKYIIEGSENYGAQRTPFIARGQGFAIVLIVVLSFDMACIL